MKSTLLDKSFRILERIASSSEPVTLKELAADLEINSSTASRITSDLAERKLIRKAGYHSFVPATGLLRMSRAAVDTPLVRISSQILRERLSELGVNGLFAGMDSGVLVPLCSGDTRGEDWLPGRMPLWRSPLAAVILAKKNDRAAVRHFFDLAIEPEMDAADVEREYTFFSGRCRMASENGYLIFRDPRVGWSVNFPVIVPDEIFGVSLFGRDTDSCNMERMQFECSRLASKLTSELNALFYG